MSLIINALKKAQQLRLKEPKGTPFPTSSLPYSKKSLRNLGKRWIVIGVGLASLVIFSLIFWRLAFPPSTSIPIRIAVRIEKKAPAPIEDKKPQVPSKDILSSSKDAPSPPKDKEPAEGLPYVGAVLSGRPSPSVSKDVLSMSKDALSPEFIEGPKSTLSLPKGPQIEKSSPKIEPSIREKREEPPIKQMAMEKKVIKPMPPTKSATEKSLSPPSPTPLKEKAPAKSIEVKREVEKERPFASEILTHFNLGVQFYNQREFSKAIQAYQKVIELNPTYIEAYNNLGIIYQEIGNLDRAFGAYQKSIKINPRYEKGHNNLGILLYLKGRNEEALEAFQKALAINSNNIESHINLGVLFKKQGQLNKAIESYQKALDINPLYREIHYNIALLYEQLENVELAIGHYQQFIQLASKTHPDLVSRVQRHMEYLMKTKGNRK
jgi:Tfp pilus assembly protein PilF